MGAAAASDPELFDPAAEEIVRWASPVIYFRRSVTHDTELRGQQIKAGDKITVWYPSANRDEDIFDKPFDFDVGRDPNPHLGFGGRGPHFCLGSNLARLEIKAMFDELTRRVPDIDAQEPAARLRSNFINGIKHLPVKWTPAELVITDVHDAAAIAELSDRIIVFNVATTGYDDGRSLSCFLRDDDGELYAGLDGYTWGGYAMIEWLWVAEVEAR